MEEYLIVDGYNVIGAERDLKQLGDLAEARDALIEKLSEYQAYTGVQVYVVFDAHMVPGIGRRTKDQEITVIYTRKNQTADECIERLVKQLRGVQRQIYVATSDYTEQRVVFGEGALRKSARELLLELDQLKSEIRTQVQENYQQKNERLSVHKDMAEILEKWRRGR